MKVMKDLTSATFEKETREAVDASATVVMDGLRAHSGVEKVIGNSQRQVVPGKDAPKVPPWVHTAIANARMLFDDMYHGVKEEFLQEYLDEFCYKFNRMYFGDRLFDRLMVASISYKPAFQHRTYRQSVKCG